MANKLSWRGEVKNYFLLERTINEYEIERLDSLRNDIPYDWGLKHG